MGYGPYWGIRQCIPTCHSQLLIQPHSWAQALVWFSLGPVSLPEKVATFRDYKKLFVLFWGRRYTGSWVLFPIYEKLKDSEERRPLNPAFLQPKLNVCGTAFKGGG